MTQLARLRMLARGEPGVPVPAAAVRDIEAATGAVVAEARAAQRAVLSALGSSRRGPATARLLDARLARLAAAAQDAVSAARDGNGAALRERVRRFGALTSATCTVQLAVAPGRQPSHRLGR